MADSEIEQTDQLKNLKVTNKEKMSINSIQHQNEQNKKSSTMQSE